MGKLFLLLFVLPLVDLYVLLKLRHALGGGTLLLAVVLSALLGLVVGRVAGMRELREWRRDLSEGRAPNRGVIDGLLLLLACGWLIVPGFISDVLGLVLLVPPIRALVGDRLVAQLRSAVEQGAMQFHVQSVQVGGRPDMRAEPQNVIDVEGEVVEPGSEDNSPNKRLRP